MKTQNVNKELTDTKIELVKAQQLGDTFRDRYENTLEEMATLGIENKNLQVKLDKANNDLEKAEYHRATHEDSSRSAQEKLSSTENDYFLLKINCVDMYQIS